MNRQDRNTWLICIIVAALILLLTGLNGCAVKPKEEHYKIIAAKPVVVKKTVVKRVKRKCASIPDLPDDASQPEITKHHKRVIEILARCSK